MFGLRRFHQVLALVIILCFLGITAEAQIVVAFRRGSRVLLRYEAKTQGLIEQTGRYGLKAVSSFSPYKKREKKSVSPETYLHFPVSIVPERDVYRAAARVQAREIPSRRSVFPQKDRIDAVIFDMDGTLLDSLPAWDRAAAKYLLQTYGIELPETVEQEIKQMSLIGGARYIREKFNLPQTPEELLEGTLQQVRQRYLTDISPKPGVRELLQKLQKQGIKISVATASDKELAVQAFERLGLLNYVDFIITCDEVGVGKSSPQVYEAALERLGTQKTRTLVVEDALYALQTAKKAGFLTAGVDDPYHDEQHRQQARLVSDYFFTSFENSLK